MLYLLSSVQGVPLVDVVLAVDHPEDLVVRVYDAAGVVRLLPVRDGGVAQVEIDLVMTVQTRPVKRGTSEIDKPGIIQYIGRAVNPTSDMLWSWVSKVRIMSLRSLVIYERNVTEWREL